MKDFLFSVFPNENFIDLSLYQFGWEKCAPSHAFGPAARTHFLFHYIISGTGTLYADDASGMTKTYQVKSGQGFMIFPNQINTYVSDKDLPWEYVWLEFDGLRVPEYLTEAGLSAGQPIYRPQTLAQAEEVRDAMLYITDHPRASSLRMIGHLCLFLDALIQTSSTRQKPREARLRDFYIQEAISYMEQNYQREVTVEEIAAACQLNRSYFSKLFKQKKGCPPQEYLIRLRLSKAAELMKHSAVSIGDISVSCGYPNQLHFSRAFKQRYGVSPREWRAQNRIQGGP